MLFTLLSLFNARNALFSRRGVAVSSLGSSTFTSTSNRFSLSVFAGYISEFDLCIPSSTWSTLSLIGNVLNRLTGTPKFDLDRLETTSAEGFVSACYKSSSVLMLRWVKSPRTGLINGVGFEGVKLSPFRNSRALSACFNPAVALFLIT